MTLPSDTSAFLAEMFPHTSEAVRALLLAAHDNGDILRGDLLTLRDWLAIAGYQEESLYVLLLLFIVAREEGSLCIEVSEASLARRLADLVTAEQATDWARRLYADLSAHDFGDLIGQEPGDHRPLIRHAAGGRHYLYFQKYLRHELGFAQAFRETWPETSLERHS